MTDSNHAGVTEILAELAAGDRASLERLVPLIYDDLRRIAHAQLANERVDHSLQATALVHEAYLRLARLEEIEWSSRTHFFGAAAETIRRILVDHARARNAAKRGGGAARVELDISAVLPHLAGLDVLDINDAIDALATLNERQARIVVMRVFGGMTTHQIAHALDTSQRTVQGDWRMAKQWLRQRLQPGTTTHAP